MLSIILKLKIFKLFFGAQTLYDYFSAHKYYTIIFRVPGGRPYLHVLILKRGTVMYDRPRKSALREGADVMGRLNSGGLRISAPPPPPSPARFF